MFSDHAPFSEIGVWRIPEHVGRGGRPPRPTHSLSQTRGLTDTMWHLVESCWDGDPAKRPAASQIVDHLRNLPDRPEDDRPHDNFTSPSVSLTGELATDHPFAALVNYQNNNSRMLDLKHISNHLR
jgi:hypothetical protein